MNYKVKSLLVPFYFGSIEEAQRLEVERELLIDTEILVDYLDIKRKMEAAQEVPQFPSRKLWQKLSKQISERKRVLISFSVGLAVAASLLLCTVFIFKSKQVDLPQSQKREVLFDTSRELPASSNVL